MPGKYPAAVESLGLIASVRLSFEGRALLGIGSGRQVGTQTVTTVILRITRQCCQKLPFDVAD